MNDLPKLMFNSIKEKIILVWYEAERPNLRKMDIRFTLVLRILRESQNKKIKANSIKHFFLTK
jgi:hypothetical protein